MKLMRNLALTGAAALALSIFAQPAHATNTATGTLTVNAIVVNSCTIGNATLDFGSYITNSGSAVDQSTTFTVTCATPFVIAMDYGANGGSSSGRIMQDPASDQLTYNLYTTNTYNLADVWEDTSTCGTIGGGGTNCVNYDGTASPYTVTVYGQIGSGQAATVATGYTDSVTMTITY